MLCNNQSKPINYVVDFLSFTFCLLTDYFQGYKEDGTYKLLSEVQTAYISAMKKVSYPAMTSLV